MRALAAGERALRIRIALVSSGVSQAAVARKAGVSRSLVSHVIAGRRASERVSKALARMAGLPLAVARAPRARTRVIHSNKKGEAA